MTKPVYAFVCVKSKAKDEGGPGAKEIQMNEQILKDVDYEKCCLFLHGREEPVK
jgi:hypothetical protein